MVLIPTRDCDGTVVADGHRFTWNYSERTNILLSDNLKPRVKVRNPSGAVALTFDVFGTANQSNKMDSDSFIEGMEEIYKRGHRHVGFLVDYSGPIPRGPGELLLCNLKASHQAMYNAMCSRCPGSVEIVAVSLRRNQIYLKAVMDFQLLEAGEFYWLVENGDLVDYNSDDDGDALNRSDEYLSFLSNNVEFDNYDEIRQNSQDWPCVISDGNKLGDVVFLASDNRLNVTHQTNPNCSSGEECHLVYAFAVIAELSEAPRPKSACSAILVESFNA